MKVKNATMVNTQAISKLEMWIGQLANHLGERDKGKFPSQPVTNPKACISGNSSNQERTHAIVTLRSEKQVDNHVAELELDHAKPETDHVVEPKQPLLGKKRKRVTTRKREVASHLQSLPLLITLRGHLSRKLHILRD
jgi:hypothetical protein